MPGSAYLLDTDWIIDHLSGVEHVSRKILELDRSGLVMSIISVAELYEGFHFSRDPVRSLASFRRFQNGIKIIGLDEEICSWFGKERAGCVRPVASSVTSIYLSPARPFATS